MDYGQPMPITEKTFTEGALMLARFWLIGPNLNRNGWRTPVAAVERCAESFIGRPLIHFMMCLMGRCQAHHITASPGSPCMQALELQEPYRVGTIRRVERTAEGKAYAVVEIHRKETRDRIDSGSQMFVSPAICPTSRESVTYDGIDTWGRQVRVLNDWNGLHLAIVDSPAYGPEARLVSSCKGAQCDDKLGLGLPEFATIRSGQSELPPLRGPSQVRPGETSIVRNIDRDQMSASDLMRVARGELPPTPK